MKKPIWLIKPNFDKYYSIYSKNILHYQIQNLPWNWESCWSCNLIRWKSRKIRNLRISSMILGTLNRLTDFVISIWFKFSWFDSQIILKRFSWKSRKIGLNNKNTHCKMICWGIDSNFWDLKCGIKRHHKNRSRNVIVSYL
jgi:hypothetical protein